jgi:DNA-3-methyladenine glycosylase
MKTLPRSFYTRSTLTVAKELLGKVLVRNMNGTILSGMIVETEAYLWNDPASHSFRGKTNRNSVMFNEGGYLYVYFTYGMHYCANVVTNREGRGEAVLIRALEPFEGIEEMVKKRKIEDGARLNGGFHLKNLTNGPAKLSQAMGLTKEHSGTDLLKNEIYITEGELIPRSRIVSATRIGISSAKEKKWRFYIKGNMWVSKKEKIAIP